MKSEQVLSWAVVAVIVVGAVFVAPGRAPDSPKAPEEINSETYGEFELKERCASYRGDIEKKMETTLWSSYFIDEIFYSSKENSCLYAVSAYQKESLLSGASFSGYVIWDYLTGEMLFYRDTSLTNGQDIVAMYQNARRYLKGEAGLEYDRGDWDLSD